MSDKHRRCNRLLWIACKSLQVPYASKIIFKLSSCIGLMINALEWICLDNYLDKTRWCIHDVRRTYGSLEARFDSAHERSQAQSYLESTTSALIHKAEQWSKSRVLDIAHIILSNVGLMWGSDYLPTVTAIFRLLMLYATTHGPSHFSTLAWRTLSTMLRWGPLLIQHWLNSL